MDEAEMQPVKNEGKLPVALRIALLLLGVIFGFFLINAFMAIPIMLLFGWIGAAKSKGKAGDGMQCFMTGVTSLIFAFIIAFMLAVNGEEIR